MTTDHNAPYRVDDGDADVTAALRNVYAAPDGPLYWSGLERRIMTRIAEVDAPDSWWVVPTPWVRIGLIAAGFALIVAGSLFLRMRAEQRQMAFDGVVGPTASGPMIAIREGQTERQTTYNYITGR